MSITILFQPPAEPAQGGAWQRQCRVLQELRPDSPTLAPLNWDGHRRIT